MKIVIIGAGKVGYALARQLSGEGHDLTLVDKKASALQNAENMMDVMCVDGNGVSLRVLREAGADTADLEPVYVQDQGAAGSGGSAGIPCCRKWDQAGCGLSCRGVSVRQAGFY